MSLSGWESRGLWMHWLIFPWHKRCFRPGPFLPTLCRFHWLPSFHDPSVWVLRNHDAKLGFIPHLLLRGNLCVWGGGDIKTLDYLQFQERDDCREGGMQEGREAERGLSNGTELEVTVQVSSKIPLTCQCRLQALLSAGLYPLVPRGKADWNLFQFCASHMRWDLKLFRTNREFYQHLCYMLCVPISLWLRGCKGREVHQRWGEQGLWRASCGNEVNDRKSFASGEVVAEGVLDSIPWKTCLPGVGCKYLIVA